jgi:glycerol-3-phosphate dehydrogenase (NAD(P)+)
MTLQVTTIGDGAMATVCSQILAQSAAGKAGKSGVLVKVWGRDAARLAAMNASRENLRYLPGISLHANISFEPDPAKAFAADADERLILCAIPTQFIRETLERLRTHIPPAIPVVSVAKGIEVQTLRRPSEMILEVLGPRGVAALSGPSIAGELARKLPTTMVVAGNPSPANSNQARDLPKWVQELFTTPYLRVYRNDDLIGVELAGALKNVIAIAAGILDGMRAGNNAKAALLSRGLVEISRFGVALGAQPETFAGLAGLGDLVTTCVSPEGRNRSFGERIGRGETVDAATAAMVGVIEGVPTCASVVQMARAKGIAMPISESLHAVLFEGRDPRSQVADLMSRAMKTE